MHFKVISTAYPSCIRRRLVFLLPWLPSLYSRKIKKNNSILPQNITDQNIFSGTAYFVVSCMITTFSKFQGKNYLTGLQEHQQQLFIWQFLRMKKFLHKAMLFYFTIKYSS